MLLWEVLLTPGDFSPSGVTERSVSRKGKGLSSRKRLPSTQTAVSCHRRERSCKRNGASSTEWVKLPLLCKHPLQSLEHRRVFQLMMQEPWAGLKLDIRRKLKSSIGGSCLWCRGEGWIWLDDPGGNHSPWSKEPEKQEEPLSGSGGETRRKGQPGKIGGQTQHVWKVYKQSQ